MIKEAERLFNSSIYWLKHSKRLEKRSWYRLFKAAMEE